MEVCLVGCGQTLFTDKDSFFVFRHGHCESDRLQRNESDLGSPEIGVVQKWLSVKEV